MSVFATLNEWFFFDYPTIDEINYAVKQKQKNQIGVDLTTS